MNISQNNKSGQKDKTGKKSEKKQRRLRVLLYVALFLCLFPIVLLTIYRFSFVHPVSTLMLRDIALFRNYERQWVPLEDISPQLVRAVLMSEDGQFCNHSGVDWGALKTVIGNGQSRGASTVTMQTVKNLFLWNGRSYLRKAMEIPLALSTDVILSKHRQLEIYLNIVEWAPGVYGAEAASQHYFKRSAKSLSSHQAAALATTLPNPYLRNPLRPGRYQSQSIQRVKQRMQQADPYIVCAFQ